MDFFGIGNGIKAAVGMYSIMSRRTGRTTEMINSLQDGDMVVFRNKREAGRVKRICMERGIENVTFTCCDPAKPEELFHKSTPRGRVIFDHSWVEEFYQRAVSRAENNIDSLRNQLSGFGEPHMETRLAAKEYHKMRRYFFDV